MILVPEIETVVILPPRTSSHSLKHAIAKRYPRSFILYRHMEADGIPFGYDRWAKVGLLRDPYERLWSMFKYCRDMFARASELPGEWERGYVETQQRITAGGFEYWLLFNEVPFTGAWARDDPGRFYPFFSVRHYIPENRKSQWVYLRPDLGTEVYKFSDLAAFHERLDAEPAVSNASTTEPLDPLKVTEAMVSHVNQWHQWDVENWY